MVRWARGTPSWVASHTFAQAREVSRAETGKEVRSVSVNVTDPNHSILMYGSTAPHPSVSIVLAQRLP